MILFAFQSVFSLFFHYALWPIRAGGHFFLLLLFISYKNCYSRIAIWTLFHIEIADSHFIRSNNNLSEEHSVYFVHLVFEWRIYYIYIHIIWYSFFISIPFIINCSSLQTTVINWQINNWICWTFIWLHIWIQFSVHWY